MQLLLTSLLYQALLLVSIQCQNLGDIPSCAVRSMLTSTNIKTDIFQESAAVSSIESSGCDLTNITCICTDQSFINSLLPVVEKNCDASDLNSKKSFEGETQFTNEGFSTETEVFAQSLCAGVGVTLSVSGLMSATAMPTAVSTASNSAMSTVTGSSTTATASATAAHNSATTLGATGLFNIMMAIGVSVIVSAFFISAGMVSI